MLKKLIALGAFAAAALAVPAGSAHADDGYAPLVPTTTHIVAKATKPGSPVILTVSASANDPRIPKGDIAVRVLGSTHASAAHTKKSTVLFRTTVHFTGDPIKIEGPSLPKGTYGATAALSPDRADYFLPSKDATTFRVGLGAPQEPDNGDNLPDTGGPNLAWLLLGSGLVLGGSGSVVFARRRSPAAA